MTRLSALRLCGFKSFAEETELQVKPGLTGVVGPNGCGKSNLLEALRWVMGETSRRNMRARDMDDVIFAGAPGRGKRDSAEVRLALDNPNRNAPAPWSEEPTIEITRRIERAMGSSYRVNAQDTRARDVQTFFADIGIGAHASAMVQQGQVSQLILARPTERRRLLEEAAGVAGLATRRHDATLRLDACARNLERADAKVDTLASRLRGLRRQARQAESWRRLDEEIRRADTVLAWLTWRDADAARLACAQARAQAAQAVRAAEAAAAQAAQAHTEAAAKVDAARKPERAAHVALAQANAAGEASAQKAQDAAEAATLAKTRLAETRADAARAEAAAKDFAEEATRLASDLAALAHADDAEAADAQDAARSEAAAKARETAQAALDAGAQEEATLDADIAATARARADAASERARAEDARATLTRKAGEIQQGVAALTASLAGLDSRLTEAETALQQARQARDGALEALETARTHANDARATYADAARALAAREAEVAALSKVAATGDEDETDAAWSRAIDAFVPPAGLETLFASALGDGALAALGEGAEAAKAFWRSGEAIPAPAPAPAWGSGATPLAALASPSPALARLFAYTAMLDEGADAEALAAGLAPGQTLVARDGALWRWDGFTARAGALSAQRARAEAALRLGRAQTEVADLRGCARACADAKTQADTRATEQAQAAQTARAATDAQTQAHARLELERARDAARLRAGEADAARSQAQAQAAEGALAALVRRHGDLTERLQAAQERRDNPQRQAALADLRAQHSQAHAEAARVEAARSARAKALALETARRDALARALADAQRRTQEAQTRLTTLNTRLADNAARARLAEAAPQALAEHAQTLEAARAQARTTSEAARAALVAAETHARTCGEAAQTATQAHAKAREDLARTETAEESALARTEEAARRLADDYTLPNPMDAPEQAKFDPTTLEAPAALRRRLDAMKRERDGMGSVNLTAAGEAQALETEHATLEHDRNDLRQAHDSLRKGLRELNAEGRARMRKAYDAVSERFQTLFARLFQGGKARLELTDSDDVLEAGLEIIVQPPGKRSQSLSLLSGGEQALTALALIFATFLSNPAPACILDEADAPLDDANVARLCDMMRDIANETGTRFLIITHHPLTMARVDRLYGVTMSEPGVSRIVSVDLAEAEEMAEDSAAVAA